MRHYGHLVVRRLSGRKGVEATDNEPSPLYQLLDKSGTCNKVSQDCQQYVGHNGTNFQITTLIKDAIAELCQSPL